MEEPRLRGRKSVSHAPWAIGTIPDDVVLAICRQIVHRLVVGHADITGDDFGTIFAEAVQGDHRQSPLGVADVVWNGCAWSVKTVKVSSPLEKVGQSVRLISGRNSPDYSMGISDPRKDPEATGKAVLSIWNQRVAQAMEQSDDVRVMVLCRNMQTKQFLLFEESCLRFPAGEYAWQFNDQDNLEGHRKTDKVHCFTWQPHGSQFTVIRTVPGSACRFQIPRTIPMLEMQQILNFAKYKDDWVEILPSV